MNLHRTLALVTLAACVLPRVASSQCTFCPSLITIPAGSFAMGSPDDDFDGTQYERPRHRVRVERFELGRYAVTVDQWDACVADGGCVHRPLDHGWGRGRQPVVDVS
jgi:formylglycine-generating enzyme required for sulfatase activity